MRSLKALAALLLLSSGLSAQFTGNARRIQGQAIKSPLSCSDGYVLSWVAANSRFECLAAGGPAVVTSLNTTVYADQQAGADFGAKVNASIALLPTTGGVVNATGFHGINLFTTNIVINKPNVTLQLGEGTYSFCGTGDVVNIATDSLAAAVVYHTTIVGAGKWATTLGARTSCGTTSDSVVHTHWTTHTNIKDITLFGKATKVLWEDQAMDTRLDSVVVQSSLTSAGSSACYLTGTDYHHSIAVSCVGGEYGFVLEANATVVPVAVRTALGIGAAGTDMNIAWGNVFTDLQVLLAQKTNILIRCSGASGLVVSHNTFLGIRSQSSGQDLADTDDDNGLSLSCPAPVGGEIIQGNYFYDYNSWTDGQHGLYLYGNVRRNGFFGTDIFSNGAVGANAAYGVWLRNGTGVQPVENYIFANAEPDSGIVANKSFLIDSNATRNTVRVNVGAGTYTITGVGNDVEVINTVTTALFLGGTNFCTGGCSWDVTSTGTIRANRYNGLGAVANSIPRASASEQLADSMLVCTGTPVTCTLRDTTASTGATRLSVLKGAADTVLSPTIATDALISGAVVSSGAYATATNCSSSASPAVCSAAAAGSVTVAATATTKVVNTTAVTANSQIILTNDSSLGTKLSVTCNTQSSLVLGSPRVTARTAATSFTISIDVGPTTNPMCISYQIVN